MEDLDLMFDYQNLWKLSSYDFKSLVWEVQSTKDITVVTDGVLDYQNNFLFQRPVWDKDLLKGEELKEFKIDDKMINRVYYIDNSKTACKLLCRMKYKDMLLFLDKTSNKPEFGTGLITI